MGRKGGNRGMPKWWQGKKLIDDIDGAEIYELDSRTTEQRGLKMDKVHFDSLTDEDREKSIKRRTQ